MTVEGIDVSNHQATVDWNAVAKAGKAFVYAKASQGDYYVDSFFAYNRTAAKAAGLLVGAYHFFDPHIDAVKQAEFFCKVVGSIPAGDLPPALDFESLGNKNGLTGAAVPRDQAIHAAVVWLTEVQNRTGRHPIIYTYPDFVVTDLGNTRRFSGNTQTGDSGWPLWWARYAASPLPYAGGWKAYTIWQWDDVGQCPGVAGHCDMDRFAGSPDDLKRFAGL